MHLIFPFELFSIVCVGGDGMFTELLNGLLMRTMKDNGISNPRHDTSPIRPDLRIGIIPAGKASLHPPPSHIFYTR